MEGARLEKLRQALTPLVAWVLHEVGALLAWIADSVRSMLMSGSGVWLLGLAAGALVLLVLILPARR